VVALRSETHIPSIPRRISAQTGGKPGILKFQHPPSPLPQPIDPREPVPVASPCKECTANRLPCQRRADWVACIPCHTKRKRCSLTPIIRALRQAAKNKAILEADTVEGHVVDEALDSRLGKMKDKIVELNARQQSISRGVNIVISGMKRLREEVNTRMTAGEHSAKKPRSL
jgi:hypothetical protein